MTWARIDDRMPDHPKVIGLSDAAFRAVVTLWCYAASHKTDGRITAGAMRTKVKPKTLAELVEARLVTRDGADYAIPNWLDRNISREAHDAKKSAAAERQKKWRETHRGDGGEFHE